MPAAARVTMYFGQSQTGWSETWWYPAGRSSQFYAKLELLAKTRVNLLVANHYLLAVRVTDEGAQRFTRLLTTGGQTTLDIGVGTIDLPARGREDGGGADVEGPPDQVRAAMHLEVIQNAQRIGLRYFAGIPDDISLTEPDTLNKNFAKIWWSQFGQWRTRVLADGWAIKQLDKSTPFPLINVIAYRIRTAAPSVIGVVMPTSATFTATTGGKVALQGVRMNQKGLRSPNQTWIIDAVEEDAGTLQRTVWLRGSEEFDPSTFATLGKVRAVSYAYTIPTWLEPIRVGIHKRGKPFGSPVGRRPIR